MQGDYKLLANQHGKLQDEVKKLLTDKESISKKSEIIGETIQIYLTLDGITYFSKQKINENGITINFNGDQINVVTDNGRIDAKNYEKDIDNIPKTIVVEGNKNSREASSGGSGDQLFRINRDVSSYSVLFGLSH